jgi:voltage-gated potassium channel
MRSHLQKLSPARTVRANRGSVNAFVDRHLLAWEGVLGAAALTYVLLTILQDEAGVNVPEGYLVVFPALFVAEFVVRFLDSQDRAAYLRHHWIDAVTAFPLLGVLRALRILRLLRLIALIRLGAAVGHANQHAHRDRTSLWYLGPILTLLWSGSAYAFWVLEHPANPEMRSYLDALYMAFDTLTTFGYASVRPITPEGQALAGLLIFVGIGLVTFVSSQLTALLLHEQQPISHLDHRLDHLERELRALRDLLERQLTPPPPAALPSPAETRPTPIPARAERVNPIHLADGG